MWYIGALYLLIFLINLQYNLKFYKRGISNKTRINFVAIINLEVPWNTALCYLRLHVKQLLPLGGGGGGNFFAKNYCSRVGGFVIVVVQMCWGSPGSTMATGKGIRMDYSSGLSYNSALWPQCAYLCLWSVKKFLFDCWKIYFWTWEEKFCISKWLCNVLFII